MEKNEVNKKLEFIPGLKQRIETEDSLNVHLNAEELECIDMYLDKMKIPNTLGGELLGRVGRIKVILKDLDDNETITNVLIDKKFLKDSAQQLTNFASMFAPVSGLTMVAVGMASKMLMKATGVPEKEQILLPEEKWVGAWLGHANKLTEPYRTKTEKLKVALEKVEAAVSLKDAKETATTILKALGYTKETEDAASIQRL